jgi:hypothetical protein
VTRCSNRHGSIIIERIKISDKFIILMSETIEKAKEKIGIHIICYKHKSSLNQLNHMRDNFNPRKGTATGQPRSRECDA